MVASQSDMVSLINNGDFAKPLVGCGRIGFVESELFIGKKRWIVFFRYNSKDNLFSNPMKICLLNITKNI